MTYNIQELVAELMFDVYSVGTTSFCISSQSKVALDRLREEFAKLLTSDDSDKQRKMITLLIGGIITVLVMNDQEYSNKDELLYPLVYGNTFEVAHKKLQSKLGWLDNATYVGQMYEVGAEALLHIPRSFNSKLFNIEKAEYSNDSDVPQGVFPALKEKADKVDFLVKFCIKNNNNLNLAETSEEDLNDVSLDVDQYFIKDFAMRHRASYQSGFLGGFFNRTNLKTDNITEQTIFEHAQKTTFFGCKNRTRLILEEMHVLDANGSRINSPK